MRSPTFFFYLKVVLAIQSPLYFHINFRIFFLFLKKNDIGILIGIVLTLSITFGSMDILIILSLLIYEHIKSFHLFVSLILFIDILYFSVYESFVSLLKFIPKYLILFDVTINGIVYLISFSDSLLGYKNATFCLLNMYPATTLNLFLNYKSFYVWNLHCFLHIFHVICKQII